MSTRSPLLGVRPVVVGATLVALAIGAAFWPRGDDNSNSALPLGDSNGAGATSPRTTIQSTATHRATTTDRDPFDQAARLFELGVAGDLTVDAHTRGALDVMLGSLSNPPTAAEPQQLEHALRRATPGEAATQAMALVRRYVDYSRAAATDSAPQRAPATAEDMTALLDKAIALRRKLFDADTAQALLRQHYSDEELLAAKAYDRARHP